MCTDRWSIRTIAPTLLKANVGDQTLTITGSAITDEAIYELRFDGKALSSTAVHRGAKANTISVDLHSEQLRFAPDKVTKIPLEVRVQHPRPFWKFWTSDQVAKVQTTLFLLPTVPLRVQLEESYSKDGWKDCDNCTVSYLNSTKKTRITEHEISLDDRHRLKSVVRWPAPLQNWAGHDHYFFVCSRPKEVETQTGGHKIVSTCFDAAINRSCEAMAMAHFRTQGAPDFDEETEKLIHYPYPCFAVPATDRVVDYEVQLQKSESATMTRQVGFVNRTRRDDGFTDLRFGAQESESLMSQDSAVRLRVYPTIGKPERDTEILSPANPRHTFGNFITLNLDKRRNGKDAILLVTVTEK